MFQKRALVRYSDDQSLIARHRHTIDRKGDFYATAPLALPRLAHGAARVRTRGCYIASRDGTRAVPRKADAHDVKRKIANTLKLTPQAFHRVAKFSVMLTDDYMPDPTDWSLQF